MSSTRFARSGRVRICVLMTMFIVLIMMIVVYHMSQQQLDETRAFRLRCEQTQEGLSMQLQSLTDDKLTAEKKLEEMRGEKQNMQEENEKQQEAERSLQQKYDEQFNKYKLLDAKHNELHEEYGRIKKQHLEEKNALLLQLQQLQHDKKQNDAAAWKHKYETLLQESEHRMHTMQATLNEFKAHCTYVSQSQQQQQLNKPADLLTPETTPTRRSSPAQLVHSIEKPRNEKSFNEQVQIVQKLADETEKQQEQPVLAAAAAAAPVSPLSAPRKSNSSTANAEPAPNASVSPKAASSSSSGQPPLAMPPAKPSAKVKVERKLPENVAPIPDNFDNKGELAADVDTAAEELPKNENNNRYANVVNDLEANKNQGVIDSGAHEVKDALNEQNFNLPGANHNLFDGDLGVAHVAEAENKLLAADAAAVGGGGGGGDDDDDVMLGDVAVKQPQHLLDGENLNNEIAGDQGKEFADGVHLDDGMDEDQDEDDYNVPARKPGADAAVRN